MTEAEERDAFYQAIMDNWDDDTPRLVYADWLDERDDEPSAWRAAFIRGQIEDGKLQNAGEPRKKRRREIVAVAALFRRWTEQCQLPVEKSDFERGFLRKLELSLQTYRNAGQAWTELGPIEHVTLSPSLEQSWYCHNLAELGNHTGLRTWRSLRLDPPYSQAHAFPNSGIDSLLRSEHLRGLKSLQVGWTHESIVGDEPSHAIAANAAYAGLEQLLLWDGCRTDQGVIALASAPHLRSLREFALQGWSFTSEGLKCLANSELLATVVRLEIAGTVHPGGIRSLVTSPHLSSLRDLTLTGNIAELIDLPTAYSLDCVHFQPHVWLPHLEADLLAIAERLTSHTVVRVDLRGLDSLDEATERRICAAYRGRLFFDA